MRIRSIVQCMPKECMPLVRISRNKLGRCWILVAFLVLTNSILLSYNIKWLLEASETSSAEIPKSSQKSPNIPSGIRRSPQMSRRKQVVNDASLPGHVVKQIYDTKNASGYKLATFVQNKCATLTKPYPYERLVGFMIHQMSYITQEYKHLYCPVEKVASTFWRRFIFQVNHKKSIDHPYQVSIYQALLQHFLHPHDNTTAAFSDKFKFLFVRDPYHRILSAYIDKLFVPNPTYWKRYGTHSIKLTRKDPTQKCFHDATFSEFVQFVVWSVTNMKYIDPHFLPASTMCLPCSMKYTYIGKMESFTNDALPIFEKFGLHKAITFLQGDVKEYSDVDAIDDSISSPYSWKEEIVKCMGWHEALLRIWRKLQMRGLIGMEQKFPLNTSDSLTTSRERFLELAYAARLNSNQKKLKQQKADVFVEMYRSVPMDVLYKLRHAFHTDLLLFNYEPTPTSIFDRSSNFIPKNFSNFRS